MNSIPQLTDDTDFQQMPSGMEIHFFAYVFFFFFILTVDSPSFDHCNQFSLIWAYCILRAIFVIVAFRVFNNTHVGISGKKNYEICSLSSPFSLEYNLHDSKKFC